MHKDNEFLAEMHLLSEQRNSVSDLEPLLRQDRKVASVRLKPVLTDREENWNRWSCSDLGRIGVMPQKVPSYPTFSLPN